MVKVDATVCIRVWFCVTTYVRYREKVLEKCVCVCVGGGGGEEEGGRGLCVGVFGGRGDAGMKKSRTK